MLAAELLAAELLAAIEAAPLDVSYFGVRIEDGRTFAIGEWVPNSRVWDDGLPTEVEVNGVCTVGLGDAPTLEDVERALSVAEGYHGGTIVLVAGKYREYGQDAREHILRKAKCLGVWSR